MKNSIKLVFGVVVVIVIIAGVYFAFGSEGFSITGAFGGEDKECVGTDELSFFNACEQWKAGEWEDKPVILNALSSTSARQLCDKLLKDYKIC